MKHRLATAAFALLFFFCANVYGDGSAVAYYVFKTEEAKAMLSAAGSGKQIDDHSLEDRCLAHGYFVGACMFYLKTKDFQFRIDVASLPSELVEGASHQFSLGLFSQTLSKPVFGCSGVVKIERTLSFPKDWTKYEFTVLFKEIAVKH